MIEVKITRAQIINEDTKMDKYNLELGLFWYIAP